MGRHKLPGTPHEQLKARHLRRGIEMKVVYLPIGFMQQFREACYNVQEDPLKVIESLLKAYVAVKQQEKERDHGQT